MIGSKIKSPKGHIFTFSENPQLIQKKLDVNTGDLIIAADCGLKTAKALGYSPDIVVGDFDSLNPADIPKNAKILSFPAKKDDTDTMLAVKAAFSNGCKTVEIAGGLGGRQDHAFSNIALLQYILDRGELGFISAENQRVYLISSRKSFCFSTGDTFSVLAWGGDAFGVSISGGRYPLKNANVKTSQCIGISNIAEGCVEISVLKGYLLIFHILNEK